MNLSLRGVLPVLQTPYRHDFSLDHEVLHKEIDWLFQCRVHGITIAMVSEILRLTDAERDLYVTKAVEFAGNRGPVVASVGAESLFQARRHAKAAENAGANAVMAIPPTLIRCAPSELVDYYGGLLGAVSIPVIVQDASGYLGNSIPLPILAKIFQLAPKRILFKPEAIPMGPNITLLHQTIGEGATIFEGSAGIGLPSNFERGVAGTMPGSDVPWAIVRLWELLERGESKEARQIHARLLPIVALMHNLDAFLAIEKFLLVQQGIFKNTLVRGPVGYSLDHQTQSEVLLLFEALKESCNA